MLTLYTCLEKENISKILQKPEYKHKEIYHNSCTQYHCCTYEAK